MSKLSADQLRKLADDLAGASVPPRMDQAPNEYVRNDVFSTLVRSLRDLADKEDER
jgi:hypothetical protein